MRKLLLNSGGLDSAILAKKLHDEGHEVTSLYIRFSNKYDNAVPAKETADRYCVKHIVHDQFIPESDEDTVKQWGVPITEFCLALGKIYAKAEGIATVTGGFKGNIQMGYTQKYNELSALNVHRVPQILVEIPFEGLMHYSEVLEDAGLEAGEFDYTFSCDCGESSCGKCAEREALGI